MEYIIWIYDTFGVAGLAVIAIGGVVWLWRDVRDLKRIVSNGLSTEVSKTAMAVEHMEGYLEGLTSGGRQYKQSGAFGEDKG